MKIIKPDELPSHLDLETITILAYMASQFPVLNEWREIAKKLTIEQRILVNDKICEIQKIEIEQRQSVMTDEEKEEEEQKKQSMLKKIEDDPDYFFGNMSRPENPKREDKQEGDESK